MHKLASREVRFKVGTLLGPLCPVCLQCTVPWAVEVPLQFTGPPTAYKPYSVRNGWHIILNPNLKLLCMWFLVIFLRLGGCSRFVIWLVRRPLDWLSVKSCIILCYITICMGWIKCIQPLISLAHIPVCQQLPDFYDFFFPNFL